MADQSEYIQGLENTLRQKDINIAALNRTILQKDAVLLARIEAFQTEREIAEQKYGKNWNKPRQIEEPWYMNLQDGNVPDKFTYKTACRQNNVSTFQVPYHGLEYVKPDRQERLRNPKDRIRYSDHKVFDFPRLLKDAPQIVSKIAKYTMVSHQTIHFIARLDPCSPYPPEEGCIENKSRLPVRWFFGVKRCAINSSPLYLDVLGPIFVSREWHEIFATAFYALNTFSFQSVGEFGIFCRRTWIGKLERVQNIKQIWLGSKMSMGPNWCKARYALHKLGKMKRLRRYDMILNESGSIYVRRNNEPDIYRQTLLTTTKDHDNSRKFRELRKMRGIDNLYQVRGLDHIAVYDYERGHYEEVRDQGFVKDLRYQVCAPKDAKGQRLAEVRNLKPLLRRPEGEPLWRASTQVRWIIENFYNPDIAYSPDYVWPEPDPEKHENSESEDDEAGNDDNRYDSGADDDDHGNIPPHRQTRYAQRSDEGYGSQETSLRRGATRTSHASSSRDVPAPGSLRPRFGKNGKVSNARRYTFRLNRRAVAVKTDEEEENNGEDVPEVQPGFGRNGNVYNARNYRAVAVETEEEEENNGEDVPEVKPGFGRNGNVYNARNYRPVAVETEEEEENDGEDVPIPSSNSSNDPPNPPGNDSVDVEFLSSKKLPPVFLDLSDTEDSDIEYLDSIKCPPQYIDLSDAPDPEEWDIPLQSVEVEETEAEDGVKDEVKDEDSKDTGLISPVPHRLGISNSVVPGTHSPSPVKEEDTSLPSPSYPRGSYGANFSLFVSHAVRSVSSRLSWDYRDIGRQTSERKRSFEASEADSRQSKSDSSTDTSLTRDLCDFSTDPEARHVKRRRTSPPIEL